MTTGIGCNFRRRKRKCLYSPHSPQSVCDDEIWLSPSADPFKAVSENFKLTLIWVGTSKKLDQCCTLFFKLYHTEGKHSVQNGQLGALKWLCNFHCSALSTIILLFVSLFNHLFRFPFNLLPLPFQAGHSNHL